MDIITSHNALDFDGLAAMVAAGKLYPWAVKVFSGTLSKNVKRFMGLYKDHVFIRYPREIDLGRVSRVILVDTRNPKRLGHLQSLCQRSGVEFYVYDHHPASPEDLSGVVEDVHEVGATTTILVEKIIEEKIALTPFEATILALGIYEDTGSLLFPSTTWRDAAAVSFLLRCGANLSVVSAFVEEPFSSDQRYLLSRLMETSCHYNIKGTDVMVATLETDRFVPGLDLVTHRLAEMEPADAIFVIAAMGGKTNIVARSRSSNIKVNEILGFLGGRGHEKAASAMVKGMTLKSLTQEVIKRVEETARPGLTARDIMSTPVKTVSAHLTMEEAGRIMLRYGHTGMPVVDGQELVGIISRRDVDKARMHDLGHAPVKGFMSRAVISVSPDTPVRELQRLMVEHEVGRLPVIEDGRLVGIVSRTDILRTLHGDDEEIEDHELLYVSDDTGTSDNCRELLARRLPSRILSCLEVAGAVAEELDMTVYMVGGIVRDILLGVPNYDIDLVVEGEGLAFARALAHRLGGRARVHERFQTAVVVLPDGFKIDIATARTEYYEFPAALPVVHRSSIREDLYRRDFTINTMAICLNPGRFGELIDYFGGRKDLKECLIRILYNLSFVEDPTRILRAIRFEQRYKFQIEPETLRMARDAIDRRLLGKLSYKRILHELVLILEEKDPLPALRRMEEIGVWEYVMPEVRFDPETWIMLRRIPRVLGWLAEKWLNLNIRSWVLYLVVILRNSPESVTEEIIQRFRFDRDVTEVVLMARNVPRLAQEIEDNQDLTMSALHRKLRKLSGENVAYLLLCLNKPESWEKVARYLELKQDVRVKVNGYDLKALGLKEGPVYQRILSDLYDANLDGLVKTHEEELELVKKWIADGRITCDGQNS